MILPTCHPFAADLLLFHQPYGDYASGRRAMEEDVRAGKERSIGLSNFPARKMGGRSWGAAEIKPAALQVRGRFGSFPWVISAETSANLRLPPLASGFSGDGRSLRSAAAALRLTAASKAPVLRGAPGAAWRSWRRGYGDLSFVARRGVARVRVAAERTLACRQRSVCSASFSIE